MRAVPLEAVELLEGPLQRAQALDLEAVLGYDPDRLLAPLRREQGLPPVAEPYPGWESGGLDGHMCGHALSALAALHASTGDPRVVDHVRALVDGVAAIQAADADGYVGGVPEGRALWRDVIAGRAQAAPPADLGGRWAPWYNLHKLFMGLIDVWNLVGYGPALDVAVQLGEWWLPLGAQLSEEAFEAMLVAEFGGMNEAYAELARLTGRADFAAMAARFSDRALLDPILDGRDELTGQHANTQIPKAVGWASLGALRRDERLLDAAERFWDLVVEGRTVVIGGNSTREHFHPVDDFSSQVMEREGPETCNTVNMVKLARILDEARPHPKYLEYVERALLNHLLSAQHPVTGGLVYFTPLRPAHYRVYSGHDVSFWCCVGTGIEAQARYGELVFATDAQEVSVGLFVPARVRLDGLAVALTMYADLPHDDVVRIAVAAAGPTRFALRVRVPSWVAGAPEWSIGGEPAEPTGRTPGGVVFDRTWREGEVLQVRFPLAVRAERLRDGSDWIAFVIGPTVLAARGSTDRLDGLVADSPSSTQIARGSLVPIGDTPVVVHAGAPEERVEHVGPGARFLLHPTPEAAPILLEPFAGIHDVRYTVYWPDAPADRAEQRRRLLAAEDLHVLGLDARTLDIVAAGEQQPETDHHLMADRSDITTRDGARSRSASGWFRYAFHDAFGDAVAVRVVVRAAHDERRCTIELGGADLGTIGLPPGPGTSPVDVELALPRDARGPAGGRAVTVRAADGLRTPEVLEIRLLR